MKSAAFTSSTPGPRPSAKPAPNSNCNPPVLYKPVTRFSEFVNVADLMAMYRSIADVVLKSDLRNYLRLPEIISGKRQIVTADPTPAFKAYQSSSPRASPESKNAKASHRKATISSCRSLLTDGMPRSTCDFVLPGL